MQGQKDKIYPLVEMAAGCMILPSRIRNKKVDKSDTARISLSPAGRGKG